MYALECRLNYWHCLRAVLVAASGPVLEDGWCVCLQGVGGGGGIFSLKKKKDLIQALLHLPGSLTHEGLYRWRENSLPFSYIRNQKYSRLRCLLGVNFFVICFYLGWSGSIL